MNFLYEKGWGDSINPYSAYDVLLNPEKYKEDIQRLNNIDMSYPIIIYKNQIVDGVYRLLYCYIKSRL